MLLPVGATTFDVSTQALVMATVDTSANTQTDAVATALGRAMSLVDAGAHLLLVRGTPGDSADFSRIVGAICAKVTAPVGVEVTRALDAEQCVSHGAAFAYDPSGFTDPLFLFEMNERDTCVIAASPADRPPDQPSLAFLRERVDWAHAAGMGSGQVFARVKVGDVAGSVAEFTSVGVPILVEPTPGPSALGEVVHAVMAGARIVVTNDVQATKRTIDTVNELLVRRGVTSPQAVVLGSN